MMFTRRDRRTRVRRGLWGLVTRSHGHTTHRGVVYGVGVGTHLIPSFLLARVRISGRACDRDRVTRININKSQQEHHHVISETST